jgi:hypothetical protein
MNAERGYSESNVSVACPLAGGEAKGGKNVNTIRAESQGCWVTCGVRRLIATAALLCACAAGEALAGEPGPKPTPDKARENFEVSYKAGVAAMAEKDWVTAEVLFDAALKALGDVSHPNKVAAEALLKKARSVNKPKTPAKPAKPDPAPPPTPAQPADSTKPAKPVEPAKPLEPAKPAQAAKPGKPGKRKYADYDAALTAGLDKLEIKAWAEAVEAFEAALRCKPGDVAARAGLKRAKRGLGASSPVSTTPTKPKPVVRRVAVLPRPVALDRGDWLKGAGSDGIWAGHQYHLEGGDMKYRHKLKGDFQAVVALEARMDHRSSIYVDLRPASRKHPRVRGYGSKEGSGPYLTVRKKVVGRGGPQPSSRHITLGYIRSGKQITFYCNGKRVAETWDIPADAELYFWVCNKGTMNAAKVVTGK